MYTSERFKKEKGNWLKNSPIFYVYKMKIFLFCEQHNDVLFQCHFYSSVYDDHTKGSKTLEKKGVPVKCVLFTAISGRGSSTF